MIFTFKFFTLAILHALLGITSLATPVLNLASRDVALRTTNTCADPSLSRIMYEGFSGSKLSHDIQFHWAFVNADSTQPAGPAFWTIQGPVCKAWETQQPFTVPLFLLTTPTNSDFIFMTGPDTQTPPVVSGFRTSSTSIVAWVYNSSVCDTVPLMSATLASQSDHYYTTDPDEHASLLASGWDDSGVVAYVLPLPWL